MDVAHKPANATSSNGASYGIHVMSMRITLFAVVASTIIVSSALAQSARDIRGGTPYLPVKDEPPPKLIMDPPLAEGLSQGIYWAQYRVENVRIENVFGEAATKVSPRLGHLHVTVDDLPWWWADASDNNTVDIAGLKRGPHKVKVSLVDANHNVFPGQVVTHEFVITGELGGHEH